MMYACLSQVIWASKPELYANLAQRYSFPTPAVLLRKHLLKLSLPNDAGLDKVNADAGIAFGSVQEQLKQFREVQRTEWFDDEGCGSDGARKCATLRVVIRREQHDANVARIRGRLELAADGVPVAPMALEVDVQEEDIRAIAPGEGEALIGCRSFDDGPALGAPSHPSGRTQAGIGSSAEDRRFGTAAYRAHAWRTVGLVEQASK